MQPGVQRCLRKAQNIWLFFFQCAKNCFVLNKGKRYIRLKLPSHHRKQLWEPLPAACPACLSRGQPSHLRVLRRRSGGGSSHPLQGRLTSPESRGESVGPRIHLPLEYSQNTVTLSTTGSEVAGGVMQAPHPHLRAHVCCTACMEQSSSLASFLR